MNAKEEALGEHISQFLDRIKPAFDSVVMLATYQEQGKTKIYVAEVGNAFANQGAAISYIDGTIEVPEDEKGEDA